MGARELKMIEHHLVDTALEGASKRSVLRARERLAQALTLLVGTGEHPDAGALEDSREAAYEALSAITAAIELRAAPGHVRDLDEKLA